MGLRFSKITLVALWKVEIEAREWSESYRRFYGEMAEAWVDNGDHWEH